MFKNWLPTIENKYNKLSKELGRKISKRYCERCGILVDIVLMYDSKTGRADNVRYNDYCWKHTDNLGNL